MHNIYMNQPGQTATPQYQAMPGAATGGKFRVHKCFASMHYFIEFILPPDPNMVNAYMYQTAGNNGQAAAPPPAQGAPNTSPSYSNYQPTPSQGYQV